MARRLSTINLLGQTGSFIDRFINWALTIGRVVVIATELIALSAFLYRFSLDRQLIDLHSKIKQEQLVVAYLKDNEETYRNLQERLSLASDFSKKGIAPVKILGDLINFTPTGISFNEITIQEDRIRINANSTLVSALSDFTKSLKAYSKTSSVIVDKIENKSSSASITVSITTLLKQ